MSERHTKSKVHRTIIIKEREKDADLLRLTSACVCRLISETLRLWTEELRLDSTSSRL